MARFFSIVENSIRDVKKHENVFENSNSINPNPFELRRRAGAEFDAITSPGMNRIVMRNTYNSLALHFIHSK